MYTQIYAAPAPLDGLYQIRESRGAGQIDLIERNIGTKRLEIFYVLTSFFCFLEWGKGLLDCDRRAREALAEPSAPAGPSARDRSQNRQHNTSRAPVRSPLSQGLSGPSGLFTLRDDL